ncbi:hypothetical protein [Nocardia gipuzkoensis]
MPGTLIRGAHASGIRLMPETLDAVAKDTTGGLLNQLTETVLEAVQRTFPDVAGNSSSHHRGLRTPGGDHRRRGPQGVWDLTTGAQVGAGLASVLSGYLLRENRDVSDATSDKFIRQLGVPAVVAPASAVALVGC